MMAVYRDRILLLVLLALLLGNGGAAAQVRPVYDQGASGLLRLLQRLQTTASVMHTGAHPDDEDSALVAYHARRDGARTAYLSLTRGSGGQNILGPEQSDQLGIIRTEELLQARRLDGAEQFFTRASDFGFSKHRSEAERLWDENLVLGDMVRAIREFRPLVVVSRWTGTSADGHGHHQYAGYLTPLAIAAAADPHRFADQLDNGLAPWQVRKFYVQDRIRMGDAPAGRLIIDTGSVDPAAGRSYYQIGMHGRSQQKTQQMGSMELYGSQYSALRLVDSVREIAGGEENVFTGLDTSLGALTAFEEAPAADLGHRLAELERHASAAFDDYDPRSPSRIVPALASGLSVATSLRDRLRSDDARRLLDEKIRDFSEALLMASGISVDAVADRETVVAGDSLRIALRVFADPARAAGPAEFDLRLPAGYRHRPAASALLGSERGSRRREQPAAEAYFDVDVPADAELTQPYWLKNERRGFMYDWSGAAEAATRPFGRPLATAMVRLQVGEQAVGVEREVVYRFADRIRGEIRRRLDVVPRLTLAPRSRLEIIPAGKADKRVEVLVVVDNQGGDPIEGSVQLELPAGWASSGDGRFMLGPAPASTAVSFIVSIPDSAAAGEYRLAAAAAAHGVEYRLSLESVAYPHISTHRSYRTADVVFQLVDVAVPALRVGYVMGSGDRVPEALGSLGIEVSLLDDAALATGDLDVFDAIVVGIRASQTRSAFVANNARLLRFAERGGTLIVQYQQPDYLEQKLAPFPATMGDRTIRVVDETAPVRVLVPEHPVFSYPNRIGAEDFAGWVQERNNYNFATFDESRYIALTESHDEGEPESHGGMVYARVGKGHYVYTGYSWFRQLPNGVPGAYRLFANLLSLSRAP